MLERITTIREWPSGIPVVVPGPRSQWFESVLGFNSSVHEQYVNGYLLTSNWAAGGFERPAG